MNNGLIIDGVLVLLLLLSFFVGAKRGLFKSLMGFVVLIAAIVGAAIAANTLTEPITGLVLPAFEEKISDWLGVPEELTMGNVASGILSSDSTKNPSFSEWFEKLELFRGGGRFCGRRSRLCGLPCGISFLQFGIGKFRAAELTAEFLLFRVENEACRTVWATVCNGA